MNKAQAVGDFLVRLRRKQRMMLRAEELGSRYLANANEAAEQGKTKKAEKLYEKSQFWLDRYNQLAGNN